MEKGWETMPESWFDCLRLFQDLDFIQRTQVKPLFIPCDFPAGSTIFEQGDSTEYLYLVVDGEVEVRYKPDDGPPLSVAHVRPEGAVGWSAALGSPAYTSSAICATDCRMLRVRGPDLRSLCERHPETGVLILERLATVIAERLRNTHEQVMALLQQGLRISPAAAVQ